MYSTTAPGGPPFPIWSKIGPLNKMSSFRAALERELELMSEDTKLRGLELEEVEETGKELGRGSYGVVLELRVKGLR